MKLPYVQGFNANLIFIFIGLMQPMLNMMLKYDIDYPPPRNRKATRRTVHEICV